MSKLFAALAVGLIAGALLAHFLYPRVDHRVEYKDRIKVETRIVTRVVERKAPDGSSETVTEIIDNSNSISDSTLIAIKAAQKQYVAGVSATFDWAFRDQPQYGITVGRRLLGPLFVTASASKDAGSVGLLVEF